VAKPRSATCRRVAPRKKCQGQMSQAKLSVTKRSQATQRQGAPLQIVPRQASEGIVSSRYHSSYAVTRQSRCACTSWRLIVLPTQGNKRHDAGLRGGGQTDAMRRGRAEHRNGKRKQVTLLERRDVKRHDGDTNFVVVSRVG
jgi:hypothetical protein